MHSDYYVNMKKKVECVECKSVIENILHILKECKVTRINMQIDEFIDKEEKDLEVVKKNRKRREKDNENKIRY